MSGAADARFMRLALALGRRGLGNTWPNPAVGALIVRDGTIVGRGWTQPGGRPHAEVEALARAGAAARGATLHVTLEPCSHVGKSPPCADAIIAAGIARVVSAVEDPNPLVAGQGHAKLRTAGIDVTIGVCAADARHAHAGHISRVTRGRPHVTLKLAVSADGMIGGVGRVPVALTGEMANARVHLLRAQSDAVLVGIGTALADDPRLTCRLPGLADRSPVRVVLDPRARLPLTSKLVASARQVPLWLVCGVTADPKTRADLEGAGVAVIAMDNPRDVDAILLMLAGRGITRLLVEGGARVARALVEASRVDEAWMFETEKTIGAGGVAALDGLPLTALTASPELPIRDTETLGADRLGIFRRA